MVLLLMLFPFSTVIGNERLTPLTLLTPEKIKIENIYIQSRFSFGKK